MRIWILNHHAMPSRGTRWSRHAVLSRYLAARGHEVTIFAGSALQEGPAAVTLPPGALYADERQEGFLFRRVRTPEYHGPVARFLNMLAYRRNVLRATGDLPRPDLVIGSTVHPLAVDAAGQLARRHGCKFVFEIRDIWPQTLVDMGVISRWHPVYWYFRRIELAAFRQADGVISLMPGGGRYIEDHGVPLERIAYIPNGIDPTLYREVASPPPAEPFVVSYFGAHGPSNRLEVAVEAARLVQNSPRGTGILFRFIGSGPDKPALMRQARELGLRNIEFRNPVRKDELAPWAHRSHAFLVCSRRMKVQAEYGISYNKLSDYMMAGRPTIFAADSLNNPIASAKAGLAVPPEDPPAMADAVFRLKALSPEERDAMGRRGRAYALEHHNLEKLAGRFEDFLERTARRSA
jgi:glycosyltransferase involved in cell wall biosynthesis